MLLLLIFIDAVILIMYCDKLSFLYDYRLSLYIVINAFRVTVFILNEMHDILPLFVI